MKSFKNIALVIDGDLSNMIALKQAITLARETRANLTLLSIIESLPRSARMLLIDITPYELRNKIIRERLAELEALVSMINQDDVALRVQALYGSPDREIAREVKDNGYDLVIDVSQKGVKHNRLLRNCDCQIVFLRPQDYRTSDRFWSSLKAQEAPAKRQVPTDKLGIQAGTQSFAG